MTTAIDPTPGWTRVGGTNRAAHAELEVLAARIFNAGREPIPDENAGEGMFAQSISLGLVKVVPDGLSFVDPSVRDDYMAHHARAAYNAEWATATTFATAMADVQHRTVRIGANGSVGVRLVGLLAADGLDVLAIFGELAQATADARGSFWMVYPVLCDALPTLDVAPEDLVEALLPVLEASAADMTSGMIYSAVAKWASRSYEQAQRLFAYLRQTDSSELMPAVLSALATFDRAATHAQAIDLLSSGDNKVHSAAIIALGNIPYPAGGDELLAETVAQFDTVLASSNIDLQPALAQALFCLFECGANVRESLVTLSETHDPRTRFALASGLFGCVTVESGDEWWRATLLNLARAPGVDLGTVRHLDYATSHVAKTDAKLAIQVVVAIHSAKNEHTPAADIYELLPGTMTELHVGAVPRLEEAVTDWFATDQESLHQLAASVVQAHGTRTAGAREHLTLSQSRLIGLSDDDVIDLLQRVAGWIIGGYQLAALITSALRVPSPSARVVASASELLQAFVLYNYPGDAGTYLRARLDGGIAQAAEAEAIAAALQTNDAYFAALHGLPELPELRIPLQRSYLQRLELAQMHAHIMEEAHKKSIMMSLVHRVPLKYGRAFFADHEGKLSEPTSLSSFSHSIEVPRGEKIDPVGQLVLRINLRRAAAFKRRPDAEGEV